MAESQDLEVKIIGGHNGAPCCWCRCGMLAYVDKKTGKLVRVVLRFHINPALVSFYNNS